MIKIYKWDFRSVRCIGHLAMELSDGTYISYWPSEVVGRTHKHLTKAIIKPGKCIKRYDCEMIRLSNPKGIPKSMKKPGKSSRSYEDDVVAEDNKPADVILTIPIQFVNESKIKRWWNNFLNDEKLNKYHLVYKNCATVIKSALIVGELVNYYVMSIIETPSAVIDWVGDVLSKYPLENYGTYKQINKFDIF